MTDADRMRAGQRKSVYMPASMVAELEAEAKRQGRTVAWLVKQALRLALPTLRRAAGREG